MLEPLFVVSAQWDGIFKTNQFNAHPELKLFLAILEDGINDYIRPVDERNKKRVRRQREAEEWMESTKDRWPGSFEQICETLDLDPSVIRKGARIRRAVWKTNPDAVSIYKKRSRVVAGNRTKVIRDRNYHQEYFDRTGVRVQTGRKSRGNGSGS